MPMSDQTPVAESMPDSMDEFRMAALAREMAMNIRPYHEIFKLFDLTEESFYEVAKHPFYVRASEQFLLEWNSSLSANERVKLISAAYAEQGLPVVGRRMLDPKESFVGVLDAFKSLCRNAGIGNDKSDGKPASERFLIQINLGADVNGNPVIEKYDKPLTIDAVPMSKP
jgi:hypothetical protein